MYGCVQGLRTAEFLDVLGGFRFRDVEHVVGGDDAQHVPERIGYGQRDAVILLKQFKGSLSIVGGNQSDQGRIGNGCHDGIRIGENQGTQAQVFE